MGVYWCKSGVHCSLRSYYLGLELMIVSVKNANHISTL